MTGYSELEMVALTLLLFLVVSVPGIFLGLYLSRRELRKSDETVLAEKPHAAPKAA